MLPFVWTTRITLQQYFSALIVVNRGKFYSRVYRDFHNENMAITMVKSKLPFAVGNSKHILAEVILDTTCDIRSYLQKKKDADSERQMGRRTVGRADGQNWKITVREIRGSALNRDYWLQ